VIDLELIELYDKFISDRCNRFYIEGIGGPQSDDVEVLGERNGLWEICYMERGQKSSPLFSSSSKKEAIEFYINHVFSIKHHHLAVITRSEQIMKKYKAMFVSNGVEVWQNNIPDYNKTNDRVYSFLEKIFLR